MNVTKRIYPVVFTLLILIHASFALAQEAHKPKYAADVPEFLLTPDKVETDFLGELEFSMVCPVNLRLRKPMIFSTCREELRYFSTECRQPPYMPSLRDSNKRA